VTGESDGILRRTGPGYAADVAPDKSERISATLLALVRNSELSGMLSSMRDLERTWNHKFNYPWTFLNDVPFTDEFKRRTQAMTKAECRYGEQWFTDPVGLSQKPLYLNANQANSQTRAHPS